MRRVVATGRSDYPNQINNVLCFPGFFRGMLDVRAARVTDAMKIAAASAIANVIGPRDSLPTISSPAFSITAWLWPWPRLYLGWRWIPALPGANTNPRSEFPSDLIEVAMTCFQD